MQADVRGEFVWSGGGDARSGLWSASSGGRIAVARIREMSPAYEDGGSVRQAFGAVAVPRAAWWSVSLSVPIGADDDTRRGAQLRLVRHGPSNGPPSHGQQIELELPCAELDAVLTLLVGVVSQARRDGVIR